MKKITALVLALIMVLSMCACGKQAAPAAAPAAPAADSSAAPAAAAPAAPTEKVVLRLAHNASVGQPLDTAANKVAEQMKAATNGRVEIQVFGANVLGSDAACRDMLSEGTLDLFAVGVGVLSSWGGPVDLLQVPYILNSVDELKAVYASDWAKKYYEEEFLENQNARLIDYWMQSARHYLGTEPVRTVDDFAGKKLRLPTGVQARTDAWESLGCLLVSLGLEDAYTALQTGVCDAVEMPLDFLSSYKYVEEAKYLTKTFHQYYSLFFMANEDSYQKLTAEEQQILTDIVKQAGIEMEVELNENDANYEKDMVENYGVEVIELSDEQLAEIRAKIEPVYEKNMDTWGQDCYDELMALLADLRK